MKPMHLIPAAILAAVICGASSAHAGISTSPGTRDIIPIRNQLVFSGETTAASNLQKKSVVIDEERAYHHAVLLNRDRPKVEKLLIEQSPPRWMFQTPWLAMTLRFLSFDR